MGGTRIPTAQFTSAAGRRINRRDMVLRLGLMGPSMRAIISPGRRTVIYYRIL